MTKFHVLTGVRSLPQTAPSAYDGRMTQLYRLPSEPGRADPIDEHGPACDCDDCTAERAAGDIADAYYDIDPED